MKDVNYFFLFGDFDMVVVYKDNIKIVIDLLYVVEYDYYIINGLIGVNSDFIGVFDEEYLFNMFFGIMFDGYCYYMY